MKTAAHVSTPRGQACRPIGSVKAGKVASWKQGAAPGPLRRITSQALSVDGLQKRGGGAPPPGGGGGPPGGGAGANGRGQEPARVSARAPPRP
ncbi:hypothetical protein, partial [Pseudomonas aeruginosa]|uniref:hypothetical protein n=1 Tax=Pseudomonas aeruginosa TaxID=287 RepID=UPI0021F1760F